MGFPAPSRGRVRRGPGRSALRGAPVGRQRYGLPLVGLLVEVRGAGSGRRRLRVLPEASQDTLTPWVRSASCPAGSSTPRLARLRLARRCRLPAGAPSSAAWHPAAQMLVPRAHRAASHLKTWLLRTHRGVSPDICRVSLAAFGSRLIAVTRRPLYHPRAGGASFGSPMLTGLNGCTSDLCSACSAGVGLPIRHSDVRSLPHAASELCHRDHCPQTHRGGRARLGLSPRLALALALGSADRRARPPSSPTTGPCSSATRRTRMGSRPARKAPSPRSPWTASTSPMSRAAVERGARSTSGAMPATARS